MRRQTDSGKVNRLMEELGWYAREPARVYFTGGASAIDPRSFRQSVESFVGERPGEGG